MVLLRLAKTWFVTRNYLNRVSTQSSSSFCLRDTFFATRADEVHVRCYSPTSTNWPRALIIKQSSNRACRIKQAHPLIRVYCNCLQQNPAQLNLTSHPTHSPTHPCISWASTSLPRQPVFSRIQKSSIWSMSTESKYAWAIIFIAVSTPNQFISLGLFPWFCFGHGLCLGNRVVVSPVARCALSLGAGYR